MAGFLCRPVTGQPSRDLSWQPAWHHVTSADRLRGSSLVSFSDSLAPTDAAVMETSCHHPLLLINKNASSLCMCFLLKQLRNVVFLLYTRKNRGMNKLWKMLKNKVVVSFLNCAIHSYILNRPTELSHFVKLLKQEN